jgi:CheY-like chemotaxis protein
VNESLQDLSGVRVFVVEDEFAVLLLLEDMLLELGCELAGTASRMQEALALANSTACDAAILDVNINGETIDPVAEILTARGTPVVFSTGYGRSGIDPRWRDRPVLQKPYRIEDFAAALRQALAD